MISATGVPAMTVMVNSSGTWETIPRGARNSIASWGVSNCIDEPEPTMLTRGADRTAAASSAKTGLVITTPLRARQDLARIGKIVGVERTTQVRLVNQTLWVEHESHQVLLLESDAVLA